MREIKLFLIRHGKTYCNERQIYCGKSDVSLSENGIDALKENLNKVEYHKCDYYFTSGAKRTNQTLEILCPNAKYDILENFFEYNFGDFELKGYNDLKHLKEYTTWIDDEEGYIKCPNGESKIEFKNRIKKAFTNLIKYLVDENIKAALGVIHGGSIGIILEMLYDSSKKFYEWQPKNGEGYELSIKINKYNEFTIDKVIQKGGFHD